MKILGIEVTDKEWNDLMVAQSNGKELKVIDGKIVAIEHTQSEEELLEVELNSLLQWFEEYDNQVKQYQRCQRLGIEFDRDIDEFDKQAVSNAERISQIRAKIGLKSRV